MLDSSQVVRKQTIARELGQSLLLLALACSSVGGFLAIIDVANRALGR